MYQFMYFLPNFEFDTAPAFSYANTNLQHFTALALVVV